MPFGCPNAANDGKSVKIEHEVNRLPTSPMTELHVSIAQHYHERTKYAPETIASKGRAPDWDHPPIPFKDYKIGTQIDLKAFLDEPSAGDREAQQWHRLSQLLHYTYGLTAKVSLGGDKNIYLRTAPSAGGLYPAEVYLVSRGTALLAPGLYHYQPKTHALVHFWDDHVWGGLQGGCFWHPALDNVPLAMVVTATFFRSAWRYQDRAYRRICLDIGHLLGNVEMAGALTDYRPHLIGGFADEAVDELLYLNREQEGAIAVVALADLLDVQQNLPRFRTALASTTQHEYPEVADGELLPYFHQATQISQEAPPDTQWRLDPEAEARKDKYNFPFCTKVSSVSAPIDWGAERSGLDQTLLRRRSTRSYSGADLSLEELLALLDFTYQPEPYRDQDFDGEPDYFATQRIETFVAVSGVTDLEEGCYYYAPKAQELRQIRFKNFRRELHFLCLGQELGRDAAAVVFHTADLRQAVSEYGDRAYRYLHMDAGHLGQRLNLAAIYLGLGVSGVGGFFDDQVNEVLGIPEDEAALYVTTLGRPRA